MSQKPTIVVVSGAFHSPISYDKLVDALQLYGYEVMIPPLPTCCGLMRPAENLAADTRFIRRYMKGLVGEGRTIAVIGHSYGGQVCSNALCGLGVEARSSEGLPGGVSHLIYLAGWALAKGQSPWGYYQQKGDAKIEDHFLVADDGVTMTVKKPNETFILKSPTTSDEEVEAYGKTLCPWPVLAMSEPLEQEAWREIPVSYIHTRDDINIPLAVQESMVEEMQAAGREVQTFAVDSGHCPNFSATQEVADYVKQVLG